MRQIVLASQSPRRKELLQKAGVSFTVVPSDFDEYLDDTRPVEDIAKELGLGKARAVAELYPDAIIIGSDTIVTVAGRQLGKAESLDEAREMWQLLMTEPNVVTTSVAVVCKALAYEQVRVENARVYMKPYDETAVEAYLATGDYKDKAGAYSIQKAGHLIERYEGDIEAILGLPTHVVLDMLRPLTDR